MSLIQNPKSRRFDRSKVRLAAFDLDGTLVHQGHISEPSIRALARLKELGITIALSTGRASEMIPCDLVSKSGAEYIVANNGASVMRANPRSIISHSAMNPQNIDELAAIIPYYTSEYQLFHTNGIVMTPRMKNRLDKYKDVYRGENPLIFGNLMVADDPFGRAVESSLTVLKATASFNSVEQTRIALAELEKDSDLACLTLTGLDLELTASGVNKAFGLSLLCGHIGLQRENVIAFGDSRNDLEMLEWAGFSVYVGNHDQQVREKADAVTEGIHQDGVAKALAKLFGW